MPRRSLALSVLLVVAGSVCADVRPAAIFGDHMVLQRDLPVPVWGTAAGGEEVSVELAGQKKTTRAGRDGTWRVVLDRLAAGGSHALTIRGRNTLRLTDVLVGEVWLCSGQSNMAWRLRQSENADKESATADLPRLRFNSGAGWTACTPQAALAFSACGYYFGRDLHRALDVPVGLINRSVGGTSARLWTPPEALTAEPALKPFLADIQKPEKPARGKKPRGNAGRLYDSHIRPLAGYALRGAIWYQGESDAGRPAEYAVLFPTLIRAWRQAWGQGDFPFLYVQLAPIGGRRGWEELREVQLQTLSVVPKTAMAVIIDGDVGIHPVKKQLPGTRLALAARAVAYGEKVVHSGPVLEATKVEAGRVVLTFRHAGGGLVARGDRLTGFTLLDASGTGHDADARIDGNTVVLSSAAVPAPRAARYGWANAPKGNLFNKEGLPASPFRTDK